MQPRIAARARVPRVRAGPNCAASLRRVPAGRGSPELHRDHPVSRRCNKLGAMLIYSMSVSVDGFIADREGAFAWTVPSEELFRSTSRR